MLNWPLQSLIFALPSTLPDSSHASIHMAEHRRICKYHIKSSLIIELNFLDGVQGHKEVIMRLN